MKISAKWLWFAAFLAVWCALRVFWLDADPGVPAVWEYGYNATDEGYYLDGGKEKFLWGTFTDLSRTEAFTYGFSAGTHYLSYLAHLAFGLSTWTWRLPFLILNLLAWCCLYFHLAKRRTPGEAAVFCLCVSCLPMVVAYERTASNDVMIASLTLISYVLAASRGRLKLVSSALVAASIILVKPSVFVLLPIVLAGVLLSDEVRFRNRLIDTIVFLLVALVGIQLFKLGVALAAMPDAAREGCSIFEIVKKTTTHYPLPKITAFFDHFRGLSSFPRDPSVTLLGFFAVLLVPVPIAFFLREAVGSRRIGRLLLFLSVPAYIAAVSVMNTLYSHYFIPTLLVLPIVFAEMAAAEAEVAPSADLRAFRVRLAGVALIGLFLVGLLALTEIRLDPRVAQTVYSRIYNFPQRIVWSAFVTTAILIVGASLAFVAAFAPKDRVRTLALAVLPALAFASVLIACLPAVQLAPALRVDATVFSRPLVFNLIVGGVLLAGLFVTPGLWGRRNALAGVLLAALAFGLFLMPNWRQATGELLAKGTHRHAEVAAKLAKILPKDAIVIGERSNQLLMSLPIRTATTFASNSDPIPVIERIRARYPDAPLFALADTQHSYNLQHYQKHVKDYRLDLVWKFSMPSFGSGKPSDVLLCRITPLKK